MTPKLILSSEGTLKYVAEWPDEPNEKDFSGDKWKENAANLQYLKDCEQAIANAVPFKNKEDEIEIKRLIFDSIPPIEDVRSFSEWKMEPLKPYDVPENVKIIVMREVSIGKWNQFAFIKHEPKEEAESQDELWQEVIKLWLHSETLDELKYRFRIERIK